MDVVLGLAIVFATLTGPILAVLVTRWIDNRRAERDRRLDVFRALMRTRKAALQPDHVNALNLVEIEFHKVQPVLVAYRQLMRHFNNVPTPVNEAWMANHRSLLTRLLSEMANLLGYKIEQLDVFEGGYYPLGWGQVEEQQVAMRLGLLELLAGKRTLPVHVAQNPVAPQSSLFQTTAERLTPSATAP